MYKDKSPYNFHYNFLFLQPLCVFKFHYYKFHFLKIKACSYLFLIVHLLKYFWKVIWALSKQKPSDQR